jgi:hypothetical protein
MTSQSPSRDAGTRVTLQALWYIAVIATVGLAISAYYGSQFSTRGAVLAILSSTLGYAFGGLGGFLFGFPRYTDSATVANLEDLKKALSRESEASASGPRGRLNANTNLERIVDWLMSIIVGGALVNIRELSDWAMEIFRKLTIAIEGNQAQSCIGPICTESFIPGAVLVLPFVIGGFLHLYLWARRYLPGEWTAADEDFSKVVAQLEGIETSVNRLGSQLWTVRDAVLGTMSRELGVLGVPSKAIDDISSRYRSATSWDSEPFEHFGNAREGDFELTATAKEVGGTNPFEINCAVKPLREITNEYKVVFLLHNTFDEPIKIVDGADAATGVVIWTSEDFIVGALVIEVSKNDNPPKLTKLSLDLGILPLFKGVD